MQTIINYTVIERKVKYPRLEFRQGQLFAIVPNKKPELAEAMVDKHRRWIMNRLEKWQDTAEAISSIKLVDRPHWDLQLMVEDLVKKGSRTLNVEASSINYRTMKRRWGSCSTRGELVFNWHLRHLPDHLIWYVVHHELCHLIVHSHNQKFKLLMIREFGNLKQFDSQLTDYWHKIHNKT